MTTRALRPGKGLTWLIRAANLGRRNPKAIFGAITIMAVIALIPSIVQLALERGLKLPLSQVLVVIGLMGLAMMVLYPLLMAGVLRVIDDAEHGRPTHATAIFSPFHAAGGAGRLIGYSVAMAVIYMAGMGLIIGLFGKGFFEWYMQVLELGMHPDMQPGASGEVPAFPMPPAGIGTVMALLSLFVLYLSGAYTVGLGQVALGGRSIGGSLADGFTGALKNLLPLLMMAVLMMVGMVVLMLVVGVVGGLLAIVGSLIHPVLGIALIVPIYLAMLLLLYVLMFGAMYFMWSDICGHDEATPPPLPGNQVEL